MVSLIRINGVSAKAVSSTYPKACVFPFCGEEMGDGGGGGCGEAKGGKLPCAVKHDFCVLSGWGFQFLPF